MLGSAWEWLVGVLAATSDSPCHVAEALKDGEQRAGHSWRDEPQSCSQSRCDGDATSAEAATWLDGRWAEAGGGAVGGVPITAEERAMVECMLAEDEDGDGDGDAFLDSLLILPFAEDAAAEEEWEDTESTSSSSTSSTFSTASALGNDATPPRARQGASSTENGGGLAGGVPAHPAAKRKGYSLWGEPAKLRQVEEEAQLPLSTWQTLGLAAAAAFRLTPSQQTPIPSPPPLEPDDLAEEPAHCAGPSQSTTEPSSQAQCTGAGPAGGASCPPKRTRSVRQLLDEVVCQTSRDQERQQGGAAAGAPPAPSTPSAEKPGCGRWQGGCSQEEREPARSSPKSVFDGYWETETLLPPQSADVRGKRTLVLDLDETLIHSVFQPCAAADFTLQVRLDQGPLDVWVMKRPGVDEFLRKMAVHYEIVVFTASVREYADPLLDILDANNVVSHRLFRDSCSLARCGYVKDLGRLGRPLGDTIIVDNSPHAYAFHPDNALPILSFYDDAQDTELRKVSPFLESLGGIPGDTRQLLTAALGDNVKALLHTRLSYIL